MPTIHDPLLPEERFTPQENLEYVASMFTHLRLDLNDRGLMQYGDDKAYRALLDLETMFRTRAGSGWGSES